MASINHQEDDRANSSEENDQPEQENSKDHVGTGRSYECMFCKRGFTNAQALGGHMNIHRKDRAKNIARPTTNFETNYAGPASGPKIYQPVFSASYPHHCLVAHEPHIQYQTYFPCTSSHVTRASYDRNTYPLEHNQHRVISPCGEDLRLGLSLQLGSRYGEDGLDLELRLGHHP